jgi:uncharacterized membrane protein
MNPALIVILAFGIGFFSGLRAFTPIALVSWLAIWGWMPLAGSPFWFIGTTTFAIAISILALLELVGDKLPKTPPRTQLMPLIGRMVTGGVSASALCFSAGRPWLLGLCLGASGSVLGAFSGYYARRAIVRRLGIRDFLIALVEDFITVAGTLYIVHNFYHTPI